jgi:hypothetical protein
MSSNIPKAKRLLQAALAAAEIDNVIPLTTAIEQALALMDRKKPTYVAPRVVKALTRRQKQKALEMRKTGMSQKDIAMRLGTIGGRISEALAELEDNAG